MTVLAIDPGNEQSAFCVYDGANPIAFAKCHNDALMQAFSCHARVRSSRHVAIEMIASYGMPVGREVFDTVRWVGRFEEAWARRGIAVSLVYRRDVKLHLCGQARAKDGNVRQALIDRWGGKTAALGTKAKPGPLYGFKADTWQALAVAVTYSDTQSKQGATGTPGTQNTVSGVEQ